MDKRVGMQGFFCLINWNFWIIDDHLNLLSRVIFIATDATDTIMFIATEAIIVFIATETCNASCSSNRNDNFN